MISRIGRDRRAERTQRPQLPLLDRLIDDAPDVQQDPPLSTGEAAALLRRSVASWVLSLSIRMTRTCARRGSKRRMVPSIPARS